MLKTKLPHIEADTQHQITALDNLVTSWRALYPLNVDMALAQRSYDEDFLVRMAYNSNAIEGSTLTLAETEVIYEGEFVPDKPGREQIAARGLFEGSAFVDHCLNEGRALDESMLLDLHERCALDLQPRARGIYRNAPAIIVAARTTPTEPLRIRADMDDLFYAYDELTASAHLLAAIAWFHAAFEAIHPFADGNGRTGRLWMNAQLRRCGYPPISIKVDHGLEYKRSLEAWQVDGEQAPFLQLFLGCLREELERRVGFLSQGPRDDNQTDITSIKHGPEALSAIATTPGITISHLGSILGLSARQAQRVLKALQGAGLVKRQGSRKAGQWVITESEGALG